jgi:hypothetical protein
MDLSEEKQIYETIYRDLIERFNTLKRAEVKLAHYTSAQNALNIVAGKSIWLRNCRIMNDYLELDYGIELMSEYFKYSENKNKWNKILNEKFGIDHSIIDLFNFNWKNYKDHIYVSCFSEHHTIDDAIGRLSMWRAYGGDGDGVALIFNGQPFANQLSNFPGSILPVVYDGERYIFEKMDEFFNHLDKNLGQILKEKEKFDREWAVFYPMILHCLHVKHRGFAEEKEWRLVFCPEFHDDDKNIFEKKIAVIRGTPQIVFSVNIKDYSEYGLHGTDLDNLLEQIIIGPTEHGEILKSAFKISLGNLNINNPLNRIILSDIPLRR